MLHAQRVHLRKNLLLYDPTEKFILQEGEPYSIPPELPEEEEEAEEKVEEEKEEVVKTSSGKDIKENKQVRKTQIHSVNNFKKTFSNMEAGKSIVESSLSQPPTPRYNYLHQIPNPMKSKATAILSYLHFNVDPILLKCLETGQVRVENTILPGAELGKILPSLISKQSTEAGEAYLLMYLRKSADMRRLLHPSKSGASSRQSFLEDTEYVDPPTEHSSFRPPPEPPRPLQVTSSYYDGLVSKPLSSRQLRPTSTVYVHPQVKIRQQKQVQKFSPGKISLKSKNTLRRSTPWYGLKK